MDIIINPLAENEVEETIISTTEEEVTTENTDTNTMTTTNNLSVTVNYNVDKNGIELSFNNKPSDKVRTQLKENKFRWSKYQKIWYAKDTEERRNFVSTLTNNSNQDQESNNITTTINAEALEPAKIELNEVTEEQEVNQLKAALKDNIRRCL